MILRLQLQELRQIRQYTYLILSQATHIQLMTTFNLKRKTLTLIENKINKTGTVLDVRAWEPATIFEVDLYLPYVNMHQWKDTRHIKIRVASFTYRDYTPAWWDAETHTCTLLVDAAHDGPGSQWVKSLRQGDIIHYVGESSSHHHTVKNARHILLGDISAVAHFAAMHQLAESDCEIHGAVVIDEPHHREEFKEYFPKLPLAAIAKDTTATDSLAIWLSDFKPDMEDVFYIAGNSDMAVQLRKILKQQGFWGTQIKVQGFWK